MSFLVVILLGIIQGLTEFLPVSSSGHIVLIYNIFGIELDSKLLSILLHVATLFSVLIYYRKQIVILIKNPLCQTNKKIISTTITTCIIVVIFKPIIDKLFSGQYLFIFFTLTAIILFVSDYLSEKHDLMSITNNTKPITQKFERLEDITDINLNYKQAMIIGIAQGIACIPGISRSGSTIATAKICGVKDSATYSFLISIPIIIASLLLEIIDGGSIGNTNIFAIIISMVICFVIGILSIKTMTSFVKNNKLTIFSYYLIILSAFLILNDMFFKLF
ncbi:MAG: undecaprenyl-diphosphate phosphatase [Clostridiales bacterium]|nr:undecaprenyl-diphosphate phosphatase [Clostridiales bacterium]